MPSSPTRVRRISRIHGTPFATQTHTSLARRRSRDKKACPGQTTVWSCLAIVARRGIGACQVAILGHFAPLPLAENRDCTPSHQSVRCETTTDCRRDCGRPRSPCAILSSIKNPVAIWPKRGQITCRLRKKLVAFAKTRGFSTNRNMTPWENLTPWQPHDEFSIHGKDYPQMAQMNADGGKNVSYLRPSAQSVDNLLSLRVLCQ
jgi:hypothetical protein